LSEQAIIQIDRNETEDATPAWKFRSVPYPSKGDLGQNATFTLVDGERDRNGGDLQVLCDGKVAAGEDEPRSSFFFAAGTSGGRVLADLGRNTEVKRVATFSWHPGSRGPQVYRLFGAASATTNSGFNLRPVKTVDPATCGWKLLAQVDTRPKDGQAGGQYGVNISSAGGMLAKCQYLLFDIASTDSDDSFGNTFFGEIDLVEGNAADNPESPAEAMQVRQQVVETEGYRITVDTTETPDLEEWTADKLVPMVKEWYPKIVAMLPSEGYEAPRRVSITFRKDMQGVAATGGTRVSCAARWFKDNLEGEAVGAVFHELVHVVQQYGGRRREPGATRAPGWLTEGIADYLRWFQYEPNSRGAEITSRNISRARYDGNYRISANFLNWVSGTYDRELVRKLNAAIRQGKYRDDLWASATGKSVQDLGSEWKAAMEKKVSEPR
jgi:hypothetical protein